MAAERGLYSIFCILHTAVFHPTIYFQTLNLSYLILFPILRLTHMGNQGIYAMMDSGRKRF